MSGYFQFVWAAEGSVVEGKLCTAQAAMLLFGDNGTAIWWVLPDLCMEQPFIPVSHTQGGSDQFSYGSDRGWPETYAH